MIEVDRPDRKARRFNGKSDPVDAEAAARAVLSGRARGIPKAKTGTVEAIRALEVVYHGSVKDRTRAINQFQALVVTAPEALRSQMRPVGFAAQLDKARRWRGVDDVVENHTRDALRELARKIRFCDEQCDRLEGQILELCAQVSPALVGTHGVGAHVAARILMAAGDNPHRMTSEAAFAKLCGACPIPASSGTTTRHRVNRGGDRRANNALHTIVTVRLRHHPATRAYATRRRAEGKTTRDVIRCLKRYVAREIYNTLTNPPHDIPTGHELRTLRHDLGLSLTAVANAVKTTPTRISNLERALTYDTDLARRCHTWLTQTTD